MPEPSPSPANHRVIGRYALFDELASGGMATVHIGRLLGAVGFSRTVAIKRLHPQFAKDPDFVSMFVDEARLAARIRHPNVVPTLDVVSLDGELFLVMEYVQGEALSRLMRAAAKESVAIEPRIICTIMAGVLHGLHAAHEATSEQGESLAIVHRDVSPQNILVGVDGTARVLDFGVAKAAHRVQTTREGQVKGKIAYMAPEQLRSEHVDRRTDVYAASVVMWEVLTGTRLFESGNEGRLFTKILLDPIPSPRSVRPEVPEILETIVMKGLERDAERRYQTAREMAMAIESAMPHAPATEVGALVERLASELLQARAERIAEIESRSSAKGRSLSAPEDDPSHVRRTPPPASIPTIEAPAKRRWPYVAASGALVLAAGASVVVFVSTSAKHRESVVASSPFASSYSPPPEAPPSASVSAVFTASATTAPIATSSTQHAHVARPHATSQCNPPFVVDGSGIRHLKPECM